MTFAIIKGMETKTFTIDSCSLASLKTLGTSQKVFNTKQEAIDFLLNQGMWLMPNGLYTDEMFAYKITLKGERR